MAKVVPEGAFDRAFRVAKRVFRSLESPSRGLAAGEQRNCDSHHRHAQECLS